MKKLLTKGKQKPDDMIKESRLLKSAVSKIKEKKEKFEKDAIFEVLSQSSSNFIFSRETTNGKIPIPKKINKHRTTASELFDIESKVSKNDKEQLFDDLILYPHFIGLSEIVYEEATGRERKIGNSLLHSWKDCLKPEDLEEIYGDRAPYSLSKIFPVNLLEKGFNDIYGTGKKRCLRIGEESLLICNIERYLEKCTKDITKIARKDFDIIHEILKTSKLLELEDYPVCMKQIELFWRILATQWKYSGKLEKSNKNMEYAMVNGKNNFIDLRKKNKITSFLFLNSNRSECTHE